MNLLHLTETMKPDESCRYPRHCVLFADLDGTLRYSADPSGFINKPEDVRIFDNVKSQLKRWRRAGWYVIGVTNQAGPAMGLAKLEDIIAAVRRTSELLTVKTADLSGKKGALLLGVQICIHAPEDNCFCRKPKIGMIANGVYNLLRINGYQGVVRPVDCVMVGDRDEDRKCAESAGIMFMGAEEWRKGEDPAIKDWLDWPEIVNKKSKIEVVN